MTRCRLCGEVIGPDREECPGGDGLVVEINPLTMRVASMHQVCLRLTLDDLGTEELAAYHDRVLAVDSK